MTANVKRWLGSDSVDVIIRFIVVATLVISVVSYVKWNALATCQANYNQVYAQYAKVARETKTQDDAVQFELFASIWNARTAATSVLAQKAVDDAFKKYFATVEANRKYRAANPPPALPNQYCG